MDLSDFLILSSYKRAGLDFFKNLKVKVDNFTKVFLSVQFHLTFGTKTVNAFGLKDT